MSTEDSRDETLCRMCARVSIGATQGKDPSVGIQRQMTMVREKSKKMLTFLEEERTSCREGGEGGGRRLEGVIDLNVSRVEVSAGACVAL